MKGLIEQRNNWKRIGYVVTHRQYKRAREV